MENASKALLIAAGVLVSVIIISMAVLAYNNAASLSKQQQAIMDEQELAKYNKEWESYNRDNLKGTDIVTMYNKAMAENAEYKANYEVDSDLKIYLKVKENIGEYEETWDWDNSKGKYKKVYETTTSLTFEENKKYTLNTDKFKDFFKNASKKSEVEIEPLSTDVHSSYKKKFSSNARFKLLDFKCTNIGYNNNGKVNLLEFEQVLE